MLICTANKESTSNQAGGHTPRKWEDNKSVVYSGHDRRCLHCDTFIDASQLEFLMQRRHSHVKRWAGIPAISTEELSWFGKICSGGYATAQYSSTRTKNDSQKIVHPKKDNDVVDILILCITDMLTSKCSAMWFILCYLDIYTGLYLASVVDALTCRVS